MSHSLTHPWTRSAYASIQTGCKAIYRALISPPSAPLLISTKADLDPRFSICEGFICLSAISCVAYAAACWWQNRQRDRITPDVGLSHEEKTEMGDMSPDYR